MQAEQDLSTLLKFQVLFWMLAATDGHAKNFSLRLLPQGRYSLASLYDVLYTCPVEVRSANQISNHKAKMVMALLGKSKH